jgi:hypothetical protein
MNFTPLTKSVRLSRVAAGESSGRKADRSRSEETSSMSHRKQRREFRKSAVALMIVTGGLAGGATTDAVAQTGASPAGIVGPNSGPAAIVGPNSGLGRVAIPRSPCGLRSTGPGVAIPGTPCGLKATTGVGPGGATAIPGAPCLLRRRGVLASPRDPVSIPDAPCQLKKNTSGLPTGKRQHKPLN